MTDNELQILRLIPVGSDRPRHTSEIAKLTGFDVRTIRDIVRRLIIRHGVAICGNRADGGLFIPANDTERLRGIVALDRQVDEEQKRIRALMRADLKAQDNYLKGGNA